MLVGRDIRSPLVLQVALALLLNNDIRLVLIPRIALKLRGSVLRAIRKFSFLHSQFRLTGPWLEWTIPLLSIVRCYGLPIALLGYGLTCVLAFCISADLILGIPDFP